jgi:hypothetical protein
MKLIFCLLVAIATLAVAFKPTSKHLHVLVDVVFVYHVFGRRMSRFREIYQKDASA